MCENFQKLTRGIEAMKHNPETLGNCTRFHLVVGIQECGKQKHCYEKMRAGN